MNLEQMLAIERRYPNVRLIIAHVGRRLLRGGHGDALAVLAARPRACGSISPPTPTRCICRVDTKGRARRILFRERPAHRADACRRICEQGNKSTSSRPGSMGMCRGFAPARGEGPEAERITFFLYEEILPSGGGRGDRPDARGFADVFCHMPSGCSPQ